MRFHAAIALAAALLSSVAAPALARDRVLIVGVGDYADPGISDLTGPPNDAAAMRALVVDVMGFASEDVRILADGQATRAGILNAMQSWLVDGSSAGDRVLFYFSGHGAQVSIPDGNGGTRLTSTLVPYDADGSIDATTEGPGGHLLGAQLGEIIDRLEGREITVIADSCHSGSVTRGDNMLLGAADATIRTITPGVPLNLGPNALSPELARAAKTTVRLIEPTRRDGTAREGLAVWQAATLAQYSWESTAADGQRRGVFTNAFVRGLRDLEADSSGEGKVTASALLAHVRKEAGAFCQTLGDSCALGFTPELLATDTYRAKVLAPLNVAVAPPPPEVDLVDLAEGLFDHDNDFALTAEILPGPAVPFGAAVQFRITAGEAGTLLVLDTGPDGKFRRIYPNDYSLAVNKLSTLRPEKPLTIPDASYPFQFTATDRGPGTLVVLVAEPGTDLAPLLTAPAFEVDPTVDRALLAVAAQLQTPVLDPAPDVPNRARRWAFVSVPYVVQ